MNGKTFQVRRRGTEGECVLSLGEVLPCNYFFRAFVLIPVVCCFSGGEGSSYAVRSWYERPDTSSAPVYALEHLPHEGKADKEVI